MFGVDLASVDDPGQPHWETAKASGVNFVFLRSNYGTYKDPFYSSQISTLRALQLPYGPYLFLCFPFKGKQPATPEAQAHAMIQTIGDKGGFAFPPVIDIEFPGSGFIDTGMTHAQGMDWILRAWRILKDKYGVAPIVYTSARVWHEDLGDPDPGELAESPLWLAKYYLATRTPAVMPDPKWSAPPVPTHWGDADNWWFHQYQGDSTGLRYFGCTVDLSRFNYMKLGAKGDRVKWAQKRLAHDLEGPSGNLDLTPLGVDGDYGPHTVEAVKAFQAKHSLTPDGIIGAQTFAALAWVTC